MRTLCGSFGSELWDDLKKKLQPPEQIAEK
jgi:hypothetical protein